MSNKKFIQIFIGLILATIIIHPLSKIIYIDKNLLNLDNKDIFFFSDSTMKTYSVCEENTLGIDDILRNNGLKIKNIESNAYSPIIYENYIKNIPNNSKVIIPINMRSFSEQWFDRPHFMFMDERMASAILALDFISLYKLYIESSQQNEQKYLKTNIIREGKNLGTISSINNKIKIDKDLYCLEKDFYKNSEYIEKLSIQYQYHYMYNLNLKHKMFSHLSKIISYAKDKNIDILFYITPINFEYGEKIVGKDFETLVSKNIDTLKEFLNSKKVNYLDLSQKVQGHNFNDHQYVCEHLDFVGREIVALNILNYFIVP